MPHVVLEGSVDLAAFARDFEPICLREDGDVLRAQKIFASRDQRTLLIEALTVEAQRKQPFYIKITAHERGGASVRIDPMTHPDRSAGIRTLVARVASDLLRSCPESILGATNLML